MLILKVKMMMILAFMCVLTACSSLQVHLELASSKDNYTKCISGLLSTDEIRLIGEITDFKDNLPLKIETGQLLIKSKDKFNEPKVQNLETLDLKDCNKNNRENSKKFTCEFNVLNKKIMTMYTESAYTNFNNVSLFLSVFYNGSAYNSSLVELPRIYDPKKIPVYVNNQELSGNRTSIIVKGSTLYFRCPDDIKPCEVFIYNQTSLVKHNQNSLVLENVDIKNKVYTFGYKVCNSEHLSVYSPCLTEEIQNCNAGNSNVESNECAKSGFAIALYVIISLIIAILIVLLAWRCKSYIIKMVQSCCNREKKKKENETNTSENKLMKNFKE